MLAAEVSSWNEIIDSKLHGWWIRGIRLLPNILLAILVIILFFLLANFLKKLVDRFILRISRKRSVGMLLPEIIRTLVMVFGIYIALNVLSLDKIAVSLLAGAGIVGLTLAFAFQDLTSNFISGIYIDFNKPFDIGDTIRSGDITGEVKEIGLRSTIIQTIDGLHIMVPNKNIFQNPITNYSREEKKQITILFALPIQDHLDKIEKIITAAVQSVPGVDADEPVSLYFTDIDQNNLKVSVVLWCTENELYEMMRVKHRAILALLGALEDHGIQRLK